MNTYLNKVTMKNGSSLSGGENGGVFRVGHLWNSTIETVYDAGTPENVLNTISAGIQTYDASKTITFNVADKAPLLVSGRITETDSNQKSKFEKSGAGVLTLTNANNTMRGGLTVQSGTLQVTQTGASGVGALTIESNGVLDIGADATAAIINFSGQNVSIAGQLAIDIFSLESYDQAIFANNPFEESATVFVDLHANKESGLDGIEIISGLDEAPANLNFRFSESNWVGVYENGTIRAYDSASVPEPSTWALLLLGTVALAWIRRKRGM